MVGTKPMLLLKNIRKNHLCVLYILPEKMGKKRGGGGEDA
jgi:hypothetical protein